MSPRRFTQLDVFTDDAACAATRSPSCTTRDGLDDAQHAGLRALDQPERDHLPAAAHRRRRRLPRAHLHARPRAALRRPPDARQLPRLAGRRRRGRAAQTRSCSSAASAWCASAATATRLAFAAPPLRRSGPVERDGAARRSRAACGIAADAIRAADWVDNGPGWVAVLLDSRDERAGAAARLRGVAATCEARRRRAVAAGGDAQFEVRAFVPSLGVPEDPVTGSLNAGLAQWLIGAGLAPPRYVAAQGTALGRAGRVHVEQRGDTVWIGGDSVVVVQRAGEPVSWSVDHLVVGAATLEQGVAWCEATLGVMPGPGGKHPLMGTHNRLLAIGSPAFPRAYLEIIAIDPQAAAPARRRWFDLDDPALRAALAAGPRLIHWVARCDDAVAECAALAAAGIDRGEVLQAERDTPRGLLRWRISVRDDGQRLAGGALPTLIEWGDTHPADSLAAEPGDGSRRWRSADCPWRWRGNCRPG